MPLTKYQEFIKTPYYAACVDSDGARTDSKFSGIPWLRSGEEWPECMNCQKPMQLFLQLNLSQLPAGVEVMGKGLLQFFYCTNSDPHCEIDCGSWFWNDKAMLLRLLNPEGAPGEIAQSPVADAFPVKVIKRWELGEQELPRVQELVDYVEISDDDKDVLYDLEDSEIYPAATAGDKLGGWPYWIQGVEYPECRECKKPTRLVFQFDSEVNVPYMWGDSGTGHITQCPDHPDALSFGWACG